MGIVGWIVLGLFAGSIARTLVSGSERIGVVWTAVLGIVGALVGGSVATAIGLGDPVDEFFDVSTWLAAVAGAAGLLLVWRAVAD
jgi:uncharacterized membrane protein YeaQ/YmgE (transglycosylase-associated protein family)